MADLRKSIENLTFGSPGRLKGIIGWRVLDSLVSNVPSCVMVAAVWIVMQPVIRPGSALDTGALWACAAVLAAQAAVSYLTSRRVYVLSCAGMADVALDARLAAGERLRRLPMGWFQEHGSGEVVSVLQRDFESVMNYGWDILSQMATIAVRLIVAAAVLAAFDWRLTAAMLASVPLAVPFLLAGMRGAGASSARLSRAQTESAARSIEYAGGITTLRAFGYAGARFDALRETFEELRAASLARESSARPIALAGRAIIMAGAALVMAVGGALAAAGAVDPFALLAFLLMTLNVYEPIVTLFYYLADWSGAQAAGGRIRSLMEAGELPVSAGGDEPRGCGIELEDVTFSYGGGARALGGATLPLEEGRLTALVGPSGSGKSTVCRLAARFWDPDAGRVLLGGADERGLDPDEVLARMAIVFQDVFLFQGTVADNIRMGRADATDEEVREAARRAAALDFIEALPQGFDTPVGEGGSTLSGGERQRVSIARALLKDAPVVLLDEATSSLDALNEVAVQSAITELVRGRTVAVIAHRLRSIRDADRIVVMDGGRVVDQGTHGELMGRCDLYRRLWEEQERAEGWQIA
ncbi:ABC transporter ATP-binding protein [Thermophilibacter provencensis]|uniref:ABC transporter ATP-binding protein n=1 Tax=Thermophilibacter provencensis TaxID=1852386 RepID=UPI0009FA3752|nr:ABC transporter ATP-binding protein [Thermophilibacter provencensis]